MKYLLKSIGNFKTCVWGIVAEQKARLTYDNILRLVDDEDVCKVIYFLREREIVHFQRFGDILTRTQERLNGKNYYAYNPAFDKK